MQKELFEQWTNVGKNALKPMMALNAMGVRILERCTKQNLDIISDAIATNVSYMQNLANTKKVEDVVALQTQVIKESGGKAINYAQRSLEVMVDTSAELSKWFEDGVAAVVNNAGVGGGDKKGGTGGSTKL